MSYYAQCEITAVGDSHGERGSNCGPPGGGQPPRAHRQVNDDRTAAGIKTKSSCRSGQLPRRKVQPATMGCCAIPAAAGSAGRTMHERAKPSRQHALVLSACSLQIQLHRTTNAVSAFPVHRGSEKGSKQQKQQIKNRDCRSTVPRNGPARRRGGRSRRRSGSGTKPAGHTGASRASGSSFHRTAIAIVQLPLSPSAPKAPGASSDQEPASSRTSTPRPGGRRIRTAINRH